eukprot:TRINITY_DN53827_c0_g1_i1.p1 TRINITY_DN53827_c0_g1~~TRINITY_DN53827_c0_g1_i1.p1  ORF type:complete len:108 (-),score=4.57 TRINITY_DN53827_c0_g1_i1:17-301(-)
MVTFFFSGEARATARNASFPISSSGIGPMLLYFNKWGVPEILMMAALVRHVRLLWTPRWSFFLPFEKRPPCALNVTRACHSRTFFFRHKNGRHG